MIRFLAISMIAAIAAAAPGFGEEVVYFENGQAMRVEKTRRDGRWLFLELDADGEMAVLLRQVKKVEEAEPLAGQSGKSSPVANVVSAAGRRAAPPARRGAVSQSYDTTRSGAEPDVAEGQEAAAVVAVPNAAQRARGAQQGQDLVPRTTRRGGRRNSTARPPQ